MRIRMYRWESQGVRSCAEGRNKSCCKWGIVGRWASRWEGSIQVKGPCGGRESLRLCNPVWDLA
jgi:hypothetical protein